MDGGYRGPETTGLGGRSISQTRLPTQPIDDKTQRAVMTGDEEDDEDEIGVVGDSDDDDSAGERHLFRQPASYHKTNGMKWRSGSTAIAIDDEDDGDSGFLEAKEFLEQQGRYSQLQYPQEHSKTLVVFVFFLLCAWSNWFALAIVHDIAGRTALPDIVFAAIPEQPWALRIGDSMVTVCMWTALGIIAVHKHRWVLLRRGFFVGSLLYLSRAVSIVSTQLPAGYQDNSKSCRAQVNKTTADLVLWRFLEQAFRVGFQQSYDGYLCGDLLFSGHTLAMTLGASLTHQYLPRRLRLLRVAIWTAATIGMFCMIICRTHYTVDVLFGYWMTVGVFTLYHGFCEVPKSARRRSVFYRLWLFRPLVAVERNVPAGRLPNQLEWPFNRPVFLIRLLQRVSDPTPFSSADRRRQPATTVLTTSREPPKSRRDHTVETLAPSAYSSSTANGFVPSSPNNDFGGI